MVKASRFAEMLTKSEVFILNVQYTNSKGELFNSIKRSYLKIRDLS